MLIGNCDCCGKKIERRDVKQRFCSEQCRGKQRYLDKIKTAKAVTPIEHRNSVCGDRDNQTCGWCKQTFSAERFKKYCSVKCREDYRIDRQRTAFSMRTKHEYLQSLGTIHRQCDQCGTSYVTSKSSKNAGAKFCSRKCMGEYKSLNSARPRKAPMSTIRICTSCKTNYSHGNFLHCEKCRTEKAEQKRIARENVLHCKDCGVVIKRKGRCGPCADKKSEQARKKNKKIHRTKFGRKHRHRARIYGCKYERIIRKEIFARDGWKCRWCGVSTPIEMIGTNAPNEPTLDHKIPMAKGGPHTKDNVQLLCRLCNSIKSDDENWTRWSIHPKQNLDHIDLNANHGRWIADDKVDHNTNANHGRWTVNEEIV